VEPVRAVLERDFLFEASRTRAVVLRTCLAAVVAAAACITFGFLSGESSFSRDQVGLFVFDAGSIALLVLLSLLTPPLVVGSILEERQNETLPLVLATPIGPHGLAAAKLLSRWGVALLIAFAALPALAMGTLFGGISGTQLLGLVVTALALSLELAAWSLWISSISRKLATAVVLSFVLPLARWFGTGYLMAILKHAQYSGGNAEGRLAFLGVACSSPLGPVPELVYPGALGEILGNRGTSFGPLDRFLLTQPWWLYLAFAILFAATAVALAGARLRREGEPKESLLSRTKFGRRWFRGRPPARNPIVWKEVRLLNTSSSRPLFYGVLAVLLLALVFGLPDILETNFLPVTMGWMLALVALVAAVTGAAAFGHERSRGGYDLLRASLLTPAEIVRGKLAGVCTGLGFLAAPPLCAALLSVIMGNLPPSGLVGVLLAMAVVPGAWGILGLWIGIEAPTPRTAVVRATAFFGVVLVGLPLLGLLLAVLDLGGKESFTLFAMGSPPATVWGVIESLRPVEPGWNNRNRDPEFPALMWGLLFGALAGVCAAGLPRILARRMDRDRGEGPPPGEPPAVYTVPPGQEPGPRPGG
jgi:ABC-type transport system involved in multi-copper enzyme maturation permease subunit